MYNNASPGTYAFIENKGDIAFDFASREYQLAYEAKGRGLMEEVNFKGSPSVTLFVLPNSDAHDIGPVVEHFAPLAQGFYVMKRGEARNSLLVNTGFWAVAVPALLLAFGSAIAWALLGFRRHPVRGEEH